MPALDSITLRGFKSIRELDDFKLFKLNVLIGANGAGKSNLVDFFRMLRAMADGGFQKYIIDGGGSDGFFFDGPKETKEIFAHLKFGFNEYRFSLRAPPSGRMAIADEATRYTEFQNPDWHQWGGIREESWLTEWNGRKSTSGIHVSVQDRVHEFLADWMVYHVHDTSSTAPMRRDCSARDFRELRSDGGNIAAFLLKMRDDNGGQYTRIRQTIQLIAPFFDDFLLEPQRKGENELVRLEWKQKGSNFPMQPWQFSDGTMRFICLCTALLQPDPPAAIVIDEPELGLHPFAIEILAALLQEIFVSKDTQLLVSTQSPALLDHFEADEIIVVDRAERSSTFRRLDGDSLEQWLKDYSLGELLRKDIIETGPRHA